jgi:DNA polymerase IV (DinB-like DNA polymerase)
MTLDHDNPGPVVGRKPGSRIIVHVDMDSFYASVEVRHHPELAGKPVIIGPDPAESSGRGVVLTCSYEARKAGVRSAMPVTRAHALCPHAIFLPPRHHLYQETSERVMEILEGYADRFQQVSIDEAYLDVSSCGGYAAATELAKRIKEDIFRAECLSCSIGIAPGKSIAKIASDLEKPGGLVVITPGRVRQFLSPLPVGKIPGIGPKTEAALVNLDIKTIGDLASADIQVLMGLFGRSAVTIRDIARGIDNDEVRESHSVKSISRQQTFCPDCDDPQEVIRTLLGISDELCRELKTECAYARTVTVRVRYPDFTTLTRAQTFFRPTREIRHIRKAVLELGLPLLRDQKVRLAGVRLSSLVTRDIHQKTIGDFSG